MISCDHRALRDVQDAKRGFIKLLPDAIGNEPDYSGFKCEAWELQMLSEYRKFA